MSSRRPLRVLTIAILLGAVACSAPSGDEQTVNRTLTILSFNAWGGGLNADASIDATLAVLRAADADLIALQETRAEEADCGYETCAPAGESVAGALAAALGFYIYEQPQANAALWANAVLSRYPVLGATPNELGVIIDVQGSEVVLFNIHLTDYPYQPYQLTGIPYGDSPMLASEDEAIAAANTARGSALDIFFSDLLTRPDAELTILCGDFNEPSHRDWTRRAVDAGRHPLVVRYPTSRRLQDAGFIDTYRERFPDEVEKPGFTWTPLVDAADADGTMEHHDRIAFVYVRGNDVQVNNVAVIGENAENADVVITPWPSDHRAVLATVTFEHGGPAATLPRY